MKKFSVILNEKKRKYEKWLNIYEANYEEYAKSLDYYKRKEYLNEIYEEKKNIVYMLNNSIEFEKQIRKEIVFDAKRFIKSILYIIENKIDLNEVGKNWLLRNDITNDEKIMLEGYYNGLSSFGFTAEDYENVSDFSNPDFLKNIVDRINSEYNVLISLDDKVIKKN